MLRKTQNIRRQIEQQFVHDKLSLRHPTCPSPAMLEGGKQQECLVSRVTPRGKTYLHL
jgi:hypothetical protein